MLFDDLIYSSAQWAAFISELDLYVHQVWHVSLPDGAGNFSAQAVESGVAVAAPVSAELLAADTVAPRIASVSVSGATGDFHLLGSEGFAAESGISRIRIQFSEGVSLNRPMLQLVDGGGAIAATGFAYNATTHVATWTFATPLPAGEYALTLRDSVRDAAGNALDGEWSDGHVGPSGNGIAGGDFRYRLSVLPGDLDRNGLVDVHDLAQIHDMVAASALSSVGDLNFDGLVNAADEAIVQAALGDRAQPIAVDNHIEVENLGDLDGDGTDEVAVLQSGRNNEINIYSGDSATPWRTLQLNASFNYLDIEPVMHGGVATGLAILGELPGPGSSRVWIWNLNSATLGPSFALGRSIVVDDMEVMVSASGATLVGVTGEVPGTDDARLLVLNTATGVLRSTTISANFDARDLEVLDAIGTAPSQWVVGGVNLATKNVMVMGYRSDTYAQAVSINFGMVRFADLEVFANSTTNAASYAVLRETTTTGVGRIDVRGANGARQALLAFNMTGDATDLAEWRDPTTGVTRLAVLDVNPLHGEARVRVSDWNGSNPFTDSYGSGSRVENMAALNVNGAAAIALGQANFYTGAQQLRVRLADSHHRVVTAPLASVDAGDTPWFHENLVHGHTRYWPYHHFEETYGDHPGYDEVAFNFAALGAHIFTRSGRHFDEQPLWPSEVPLDANGNPLFGDLRDIYGFSFAPLDNPIQAEINEAWANGVPMIAYYNDMSEADVAAAHPDWIARDYAGNPIVHDIKGTYLDITGPYGEIVQQRLLELADMGVSAIYLDFRHIPPGGAWHSQLAADYQAETGNVAPPPGQTQAYEEYLQFVARRLTETIAGWAAAVGEEYPGVQLLISSPTLPSLTQVDMNTSLGELGTLKNEFYLAIARGQSNFVFRDNPDLYQPADAIRVAFGMALLRDADPIEVAHIWKTWSPTQEQDEAFVAAVATFGGIAALDVNENILVPGGSLPGFQSQADYAATFAFGDRISPHLSGVAPVGSVAVFYSEALRDSYFDSGDRTIWGEVNLPAVGAFEEFSQLGLSPMVLTDHIVAHGIPESVKVLFVPDPAMLTVGQQAELAAFTQRGGVLITDQASWDWDSAAGYAAAMDAIGALITPLLGSLPVVVENLPGVVQAAFYTKLDDVGTDDRTLVVALTNDYMFVQTQTEDAPIAASAIRSGAAPVAAGITVHIASSYFAGSDMPVAADLFVYDAVSGQVLQAVSAADGFDIVLPGFDQSMVLVIERR